MIKIYIIKNTGDNIIDITNIVKEDNQLKKNIKNFAWIFDFSIAKDIKINLGDIVVIKYDSEEIFSGVIIKANISNLSFTSVDYAWYFNNNEEIYQFEDIESSIVVTKLIETFGGKAGNIEATTTMVDKFYFGKTLGAIIKEIIKNIRNLENKDYRFFYRNTKFHFELSKKDKYLLGQYKPKKELKSIIHNYEYNALNYAEKIDYKQSIEKMKNSIKVYKTSGKKYIETSSAKDNPSIKKYGLLQKLVSFKDNDLKGADITADSLLDKSNKVKDTLSIELSYLSEIVYDGELLQLEYKDYSINGIYEITGITYYFSNLKDVFRAKIELEKVE